MGAHPTAPDKRRWLMSTERGCGKAQPQHGAGTKGVGNIVTFCRIVNRIYVSV
jgi:hypothetical protein